MPKRSKAGRNNWEGDFIPGREQSKFYYEHDDRTAVNTRRVSFKPSSSRVGKKGRRDWEKTIRLRLTDDDVDMGAGSAGFSGKGPSRLLGMFRALKRGCGTAFSFNHARSVGEGHADTRGGNWAWRRDRGRSSPMLAGMKKKHLSFPSNWFKIIIPYGHKYSKDYILKALQTYIAPQSMVPYAYRVSGNEASFCVDDATTAEELLNADRKITTTDGYKLLVKVRPGFPHFDISDALKVRIKQVMGKRYNSNTKALDLTCFHDDEDLKREELLVPLSRSNIMAVVLEIIADNIPELVALDLSNNRLHSVEVLGNLHKKAPHLTVLHLGKNKIRDLRYLEAIKELKIEDLVLNGNPLCNRFRDQSLYISEVRKWLPKVVKLDGVDLPPPIVFEASEKSKKPPSHGAFMCADNGSHVVKQFIEQYYQLYDSDNRQALADAYHDNAMFSLSCAYPISYTAQNPASKLTSYITESRNLLRVNDSGRRQKLLHVGRTNIVNYLANLPKTQHDPVSFTVDLTVFTPQLLNVVVTGVFREPVAKGSLPRAFSRTFVIVPFGTGYCIVNEELFITMATPAQAKVAFQAPVVVPQPQPAAISSPVANPALVDQAAVQQQMIQALAAQTGMNLPWSKKCLDETNWDFQKALEVFTVLHKQGTVPADAFIK